MGGQRTVDGIDLSDIASFWTSPLAERGDAFARLRAEHPVAFFDEPELPFASRGPGFYAVTRWDDVVGASRRPDIFRSGSGSTGIVDLPAELLEFFGSMINMDDPRHGRLRRIVSRGFTPRRVAGLRCAVERTARQIVDDIIDRGECDIVTDVAARLPLAIICDLMGIPDSQYSFVLDRSNVVLGSQDPEYVPEGTDGAAALFGAAADLAELVKDLAAVRAQRPTDDLTSVLAGAEIDGERLTPDELASFFILLVVGGNETTRTAISWGVHALTQHPDQQAAWAADIEGLARGAVEEVVRWASPVIFMRRTLAQPFELGGHRLVTGDKVALFYWSANRDERYFADPETFDIRRDPNPHVGFGGSGPHFCLGAHLARQEIAVMFGELLRRLPDLHTTGEPQRLQSMFINGVKRLPAAFTPGGTP
ncbi:MAG: cytochrome P450 [Pseudonocardiaceae bacterium]